ncbi:MAG: NAD-dependent protein deacylase [Sphingomonadaceae bacterium PASS1]|nr:MAG: NAD-dependent protein deacylase [Sphingomonadaceae bacterium PASS1]
MIPIFITVTLILFQGLTILGSRNKLCCVRRLSQRDSEGANVDRQIKNIVILTGAGVSAESGIDTFRSAGGLWEQHKVQDVATPEAFARDPDLVLRFYDMRRERIQQVEPNAAHYALAQLDAEWSGNLLLVTQNVDDLHERAGTKRLLHMHGEHLNAWCTACDTRHGWRGTLIDRPACPSCGISGQLRPDIVWFGEMPYRMGDIYHALNRADLFVSIGTSGAVYPAAGLVREARQNGISTLELNLEPSHGSSWFTESRHGPATELVPKWVDELLGG